MADSQYASPSISPASIGTLPGVVRLVLEKFKQGLDDCLPARVISYDRATNQARVQPLIMIVSTSGEEIDRAQVAEIPVFQIGAGGFLLSFPINEGDLGWIKANDRDISIFKQSMDNSPPNTQRKHSFEDAFFIPDSMMRDVVIDPDDANAVVLQSQDGSIKIALRADSIAINAPNLIINGNVEISGNLTATGDIVGAGISLDSHVHGGVQTGSGNTGAPH